MGILISLLLTLACWTRDGVLIMTGKSLSAMVVMTLFLISLIGEVVHPRTPSDTTPPPAAQGTPLYPLMAHLASAPRPRVWIWGDPSAVTQPKQQDTTSPLLQYLVLQCHLWRHSSRPSLVAEKLVAAPRGIEGVYTLHLNDVSCSF